MRTRGSSLLALGGVFALLVAVTLFFPLLFEAYQVGRGSDGCAYRTFDIPWDSTWALEAVHGGFSWWPTGLTCSFPLTTGGEYVVRPPVSQSIAFVVALVTGLLGTTALLVAAVARYRASAGRPVSTEFLRR